ncbi:hypothetical protein COT42_06645 [Candidatus Saganbacteria bacterium CG08_land_8_20_14_0_20_45_16]|uniref:Polysaccharide export protein n=1 Tax=Candidatus Saganbacteria bacterium CG08_land_8_20_14_0_20_45_16 TaxID=2014293 RepID=A0A2H0XXR0_UNCSA|nr:MAG: hypothetical protein COT42_06645 [Candidatus Saganbacteria bacterium CG08_land_8_20_14_0_20_45_16]
MKKIIASVLLLFFSASTIFAQNLSQVNQYLSSPQGKAFLRSAEGQRLIAKYTQGKGQKTSDAAFVETAKNANPTLEVPEVANKLGALSGIELFFSSKLLFDNKEPLHQYGYDFFQPKGQEGNQNFVEMINVPVGPDYIIGPGDAFKITLWGITEGIFDIEVNNEGKIVLPKVGVVEVAGLAYGNFEAFVGEKLGKYYESVNIGVTVSKLRSIQVFVAGEVNAPGSYTVSSLATVFNTLITAGGPTKRGSLRDIQFIRGGHVLAHVDLYSFMLEGKKGFDPTLQAGDTIFVPIVGPVAAVSGVVYRPGIYELKGEDLSDLLSFAGGLLPTSDLSRIQVTRVEAHEKKIIKDENVSLKQSRQHFGLAVKNLDNVEVYPIYQEIDNIIYLDGAVKSPGAYELVPGMRVKDLLPGPEAFVNGAYLPHIEVLRTNQKNFETKILTIDFDKLQAGDEKQNVLLQPHDQVVVSSVKKTEAVVTLQGEVARPGKYRITKGEKLSSVLIRAGGFTSNAYLFGIKFIRQSVAEAQSKATRAVVSKLKEQLIYKGQEVETAALGQNQKTSSTVEINKSQQLLALLEQRVPAGRVIINITFPLDTYIDGPNDIELEDGDEITIPTVFKTINVLGEVYIPTGVVFMEGKKADYYLAQVGGATKNGDKNGVYVIRADGSVLSKEQGINVVATVLLPGDSLVVPQSLDTFNLWANVRDVTRWFYEAALGFAVIANYLKQ